MKNKIEILKLRSQGLGYSTIAKILGYAKSTVIYHCNDNQKSKAKNRQKKYINKHPYLSKIRAFKYKKQTKTTQKLITKNQKLLTDKVNNFKTKRGDYPMQDFSVTDLINKFGENPKCYLTGQPIDIYQPKTYQFDHKIPSSRGGDNSLDNLGICTKQANQAKSDMTEQELIELCKSILTNNGYTISK